MRQLAGWLDYAQARGFRGYMASTYHWTGVERWFDPEIPGSIVVAEGHYLTEVPDAVLGS